MENQSEVNPEILSEKKQWIKPTAQAMQMVIDINGAGTGALESATGTPS